MYGRWENRRDHPGGRAVGAHGRIKADAPDGADHDDTEGDRHDPAGGDPPIVVVTGYQADVLERHISHRGAVCIRNKRYETSQMYGSICMGLRHIQKKPIGAVVPADVPMITADTIEKMAQAPGSMAVPVCQGKKDTRSCCRRKCLDIS